MLDQERAHLPAVAHLFDHHAGERLAVVIAGRGLEEKTLLLDAGKFGVALINDHVQKRIAHLLGCHLPQVLPLGSTLEMTELDLVVVDGTVERLELKLANLVLLDADLFAPIVEQTYPVAECADFGYLAWHV